MTPVSLPPGLSANQIKELIRRRFLAHVGWDGKKVDGRPRVRTRPIAQIGHAGIGKSEMPFQAAEEISKLIGKPVEVRMTNLQFCELPDFMGLPYNEADEICEYDPATKMDAYRRVTRTKHGIPEILPQDGFGIWFLDEPNRAGRDIRSGLLTLLQARQVNGVPLGKDWMVVLAMNPSEADGQSYEVSTWDVALTDRIAPVTFEPKLEEFADYIANKYGEDDPVVRWVRARGKDIVHLKGEGRCTPRGLEFLINAIKAEDAERDFEARDPEAILREEGPRGWEIGDAPLRTARIRVSGVESDLFWNTAAAEIGQEHANAFKGFLRESLFVTAQEIIESYDEKVRDKLARFERAGRIDVLNAVTDDLTTAIAKKMAALGDKWPTEETNADPTEAPPCRIEWGRYPEFIAFMKNIVRYLNDASAESGHSFLLVSCDKAADKDHFQAMCRYIRLNAHEFTEHYLKLKAAERKRAGA